MPCIWCVPSSPYTEHTIIFPVFSLTYPDCVHLVLHSEYCDVVGSSFFCYSGFFVCVVHSSNDPFPTFDISFEDKDIGDVASLRLSLHSAILSLRSLLSQVQQSSFLVDVFVTICFYGKGLLALCPTLLFSHLGLGPTMAVLGEPGTLKRSRGMPNSKRLGGTYTVFPRTRPAFLWYVHLLLSTFVRFLRPLFRFDQTYGIRFQQTQLLLLYIYLCKRLVCIAFLGFFLPFLPCKKIECDLHVEVKELWYI